MKKSILYVATVAVVSSLASPALACNWRQLMEGMTWCVANVGNNGYEDILVGAARKDAAKLDNGFESCQSGKNEQIDNYYACTPGQRIDAARAALGMSLLQDSLKPILDEMGSADDKK